MRYLGNIAPDAYENEFTWRGFSRMDVSNGNSNGMELEGKNNDSICPPPGHNMTLIEKSPSHSKPSADAFLRTEEWNFLAQYLDRKIMQEHGLQVPTPQYDLNPHWC